MILSCNCFQKCTFGKKLGNSKNASTTISFTSDAYFCSLAVAIVTNAPLFLNLSLQTQSLLQFSEINASKHSFSENNSQTCRYKMNLEIHSGLKVTLLCMLAQENREDLL